MGYELLIARRIRLRDSDNGSDRPRLSPSIVVAVTGIALSIVVMMSAMCVVLGFKHAIRDKVMGFDAHVSIVSGGTTPVAPDDNLAAMSGIDDNSLRLTPELRGIIDSTGDYVSTGLIMERSGILKTDNDFEGLVFRGIESGASEKFIEEALVEGAMPDFDASDAVQHAVVSRHTATKLGLSVGDRVYAYFFGDGGIKTRRLTIDGIYDTHFGDYDKMMVYVPLALAQGVAGVGHDVGSRVELRMDRPSEADIDDAAMRLQHAMMQASYDGRLEGSYRIVSINTTGMMYFNWLALLDTNVVVILILMSLVSGFTLVSSLFILILERVRMIGTLKALGATDGGIARIFIYLAERLVGWGMLIGNVIGIGCLAAQSAFHFIHLDPEAYYLTYVPVDINWWMIGVLNIGVFVVAWGMLLLPSRMIAGISPAQSIRYE